MIKIYKLFDETFFGIWNGASDGLIPAGLTQLQKQVSDAVPTCLANTEIQAVGLRTSQCWLKIKVWQLAIGHDLISSTASDITLSFRYPVDVSRELVEQFENVSQHAMEVHGIELVSHWST